MTEENKKIALNIGGMTCVNCAHAIEKRLKRLNGVINATVVLAAEKAFIDYNPVVVTQKAIEDAIIEVGYQVIHEKITLQIGGMSCINCAKSIEKALNKHAGVYNANVNFATEKLIVEYNPEQISVAGIKKAVQDVGYQVVEPEKTIADTEGSESKARSQHIRRLKTLVAASVALSIPVLIFTWVKVFPPFQNNILLFLLATPVQFVVGWTFYVGAYKG